MKHLKQEPCDTPGAVKQLGVDNGHGLVSEQPTHTLVELQIGDVSVLH
jgi:hypothetical protein